MNKEDLTICFFNQEFLPTKGGIATFVGNLVVGISKNPFVEKVVSISFNNPEAKHLKENKLEIINYQEKKPFKIFLLVLKNFWKFKSYDVFHITYIFPLGIFVLPLAKIFRKKVFVNIYGTDVLTKKGSRKTAFLKKKIMEHCDKIISVSRSTILLTSKKYNLPLDKFEVVYPGISEKKVGCVNLRSEYSLNKDDFIVLIVCRMVKRKGVDDVIKAISQIKNEKIKLMVVGGGSELENLKSLSDKLGLKKRVIFTGKVEDISNYYYSSDLFIMPSKFLEKDGDIEGLGIVFIEAQFFGKPVIGTNSGGIPEVILNNKTGFVVPENNPTAIMEKILLLKNDNLIYQSFSNNAKLFVKNKFNWDKSVEDLIEIYNKS